MAKPKLTLSEIKVNSFVTTLDNERMHHVKGGYYLIRGRRYTYRTRWTSVDTRSDEADFITRPGARKA
ncbi:MAG: hypothetical protein EP344_11915 [Bacteroidetes bacterium]|nr:MAG: hypothetical protein EP344_11915 [Bacteroidota bacterium]